MINSAQVNRQGNDCTPIHAVWNELARAWTLPVIHTLGMHEPSRFNELKKKIGGISATSLSERLTELEARGVVKRSVYPESPPRVEYSLTDKGKELQRLLCRLADWVVKWDEAAKTPAALHQPMTATAK